MDAVSSCYNRGMVDNSPQVVAQGYFDAWNPRDAAGIVATFARDGNYVDLTTPGPLSGDTFGAYARGPWDPVPGLSCRFSFGVGSRG